jgi:hypothetical protein
MPFGIRGPNKEKAAEVWNPGGAWRTNRCRSALDGIAPLAVLALGGGHGQPHLLTDRPGQEPAGLTASAPLDASLAGWQSTTLHQASLSHTRRLEARVLVT